VNYQRSVPNTGTKRRLSEKRQLELGYSGQLKVTEDENPFHTRGAPEYISERQYEAQCNDMTQQALSDLSQYVANTDYLEHNAEKLTSRAKRGLAREIARENDYELPSGYFDD